MKKKIVLIGTVLLIGNLAFAVELNRVALIHEHKTVLFDHSVATVIEALHAKGLEKEMAQRKVEALFGADMVTSSRRIDTLAAAFPELEMQKMTGYFAECALHEKKVDLGSYDALVRMMQGIGKKVLDEKEYSRLRRVAKANSQIV